MKSSNNKKINLRHIFTGIWNWLFGNPKIEEMAQKRMAICNDCPEFDRAGEKCYVPGTQPCCGICGCKLKWMTRVPEEQCSAPEPKWGQEQL